jgi:nucleotide-binding universal stress UspA family protein
MGLRRLVFGSAAAAIVRLSPVPVLVVQRDDRG